MRDFSLFIRLSCISLLLAGLSGSVFFPYPINQNSIVTVPIHIEKPLAFGPLLAEEEMTLIDDEATHPEVIEPLMEEKKDIKKELMHESITIRYDDYSNEQMSMDERNTNQHFLNDLENYINKEVLNEHQKIVRQEKQKKTYFYVIPRPGYIASCFYKFTKWFRSKDEKYFDNDEDAKKRREWEVWLGIDIFHPYYKYKEARKKIKEKFDFETPAGLPRVKFHPEYENGQFKLTCVKKF